ncbi:Retrovirus-related Pol polyprotein from transposon 17.6 [Dictyocoela muelleri]|nr:Retrovirus-related Pol polyprotein from transposon 17.6 [Dictyocoela muelleri]
MLRKGLKLAWTDKHEIKVKKILEIIKAKPILKYPDLNKEFQLETDASDRAIGSILKQNNHIVGFYSHKFTETESRYTTMEKEALGIIKSLEFFRDYILSSKIVIYTDNRNLLFNTDLSKRVQRWKILLEEFDYVIERIPGKNNEMADTISRITYVEQDTGPCYWNHEYFKTKKKICN